MLNCETQPFGQLPSGELITQFVLKNQHGLIIKIINYGATLTSVKVPNVLGELTEIVLGFDRLEEYLNHSFYFGCTVGRVTNRIANGKFSCAEKTYQLACNDNKPHHLHGGIKGFDKVAWQAQTIQEPDAVGVKLTYVSKDGEENYPGNLQVTTQYLLTNDNEIKIIFTAKTDQATPVDLTNHTYWNLAGAGLHHILDHALQIPAERYIVTDAEHIPTGEIRTVKNSPFDFNHPTAIGDRIAQVPGGYDLCFVLDPIDQQLKLAAKVGNPKTGLVLETYTTQPGLQFYTGNYLFDYAIAENKKINQYSGFCLETQNFPNAVNHQNFPSPILQPGETYQHETVYKILIG